MAGPVWSIFEEAVANLGVAGASVVWSAGAEPQSRWIPGAEVEPAFLAYSITKTFTATCLLQLCDGGLITLDDSLGRWFPDVDRAKDISLRLVLQHRSGLPDYGILRNYHAAVRSSPSVPWTFEDYARETYGHGLAFAPGTDFLYSNPGYMLLREIMVTVSGRSYGQLLWEKVFQPLGLTRTFVPETIEDLQPLAPAMSKALAEDRSLRDTRLHYHPGWVSHGVVASTPSEIARFFDALFAGGLLSKDSLAAMTELVPVSPHATPGETGCPSYGLGLMGDPTTPFGPRWGHGGGGPGYLTSVEHLAGLGATVCVMAGIERGFEPRKVTSHMLEALSAERSRPSGH